MQDVQTVQQVVNVATSVASHDFSPLALFMQADIVVKSVMLVLVLCSLWSWAIIFHKSQLLKRLKNSADRFEEAFWSGASLDSLFERLGKKPTDPMATVFSAGMGELRHSVEKKMAGKGEISPKISQRIERVMEVTIGRELEKVEKQMTVLASVGSTSPFIGLFGTVWGIMNSFAQIAGSQNTSIAVVAPGISEALLSTGIGLIAAIPAVIAYNKFSTDISRYADRLGNFATEFGAILSRHIEEKIL